MHASRHIRSVEKEVPPSIVGGDWKTDPDEEEDLTVTRFVKRRIEARLRLITLGKKKWVAPIDRSDATGRDFILPHPSGGLTIRLRYGVGIQHSGVVVMRRDKWSWRSKELWALEPGDANERSFWFSRDGVVTAFTAESVTRRRERSAVLAFQGCCDSIEVSDHTLQPIVYRFHPKKADATAISKVVRVTGYTDHVLEYLDKNRHIVPIPVGSVKSGVIDVVRSCLTTAAPLWLTKCYEYVYKVKDEYQHVTWIIGSTGVVVTCYDDEEERPVREVRDTYSAATGGQADSRDGVAYIGKEYDADFVLRNTPLNDTLNKLTGAHHWCSLPYSLVSEIADELPRPILESATRMVARGYDPRYRISREYADRRVHAARALIGLVGCTNFNFMWRSQYLAVGLSFPVYANPDGSIPACGEEVPEESVAVAMLHPVHSPLMRISDAVKAVMQAGASQLFDGIPLVSDVSFIPFQTLENFLLSCLGALKVGVEAELMEVNVPYVAAMNRTLVCVACVLKENFRRSTLGRKCLKERVYVWCIGRNLRVSSIERHDPFNDDELGRNLSRLGRPAFGGDIAALMSTDSSVVATGYVYC
jgi:hypothetical protein